MSSSYVSSKSKTNNTSSSSSMFIPKSRIKNWRPVMKIPDASAFIMYKYHHNPYEYYCSVSKKDYRTVLKEGFANISTRFSHFPYRNNNNEKILFCMSASNIESLNNSFNYTDIIIVSLFKELQNPDQKRHIKSLEQIYEYITDSQ